MQDDGGTAGGGADLDASPNTIRFDVSAINDAPSAADRDVTISPGGTLLLGLADFGFSDVRDTPANALATVNILSLPASGSLILAGAPVAAGQTVTATDIAAARLAFNAAGTGTTSFTFRVQDDGGSANGGIDTDLVAHTLRIVVATPITPAATLVADGTVAESGGAAPLAAAAAPNTPATTTPSSATQAASAAPAGAAATAATTATSPAADGGDDASASNAFNAEAADAALRAATRSATSSDAATAVASELRAVGTLSGERRGFAFESATLVEAILASGNRSEGSRTGVDQLLTSLRAQGFIEELNRVREDAKHEFDLEKSFAITATGVTFGLSVAYVLWLVRSGVLLGSLLSSLPAWRVLDPLPVLARAGDDPEDDDESDQAPPDQTDDARQTLRGY